MLICQKFDLALAYAISFLREINGRLSLPQYSIIPQINRVQILNKRN